MNTTNSRADLSSGRATGLGRSAVAGVGLALCLALVACQPQKVATPTAVAPVLTAVPPVASAVPPGSTSVPDAGRVFAQTPAAASAPGSGEPTVNQKQNVTREQELNAMPLPGQANDHSNTAGEKKAPKTER